MISATRILNRSCPFCSNSFKPSRYHPNQRICTSDDCQRRRRRDYHKTKLANDPVYKEQCRDSQKNWRSKNHLYMKHYRAKPAAAHKRCTVKSSLLAELSRLRSLVKKAMATEVRRCDADVWLVSRAGSESVKNILASTQIVVFANVISPSSPPQ
jgi:hypothetical protein